MLVGRVVKTNAEKRRLSAVRKTLLCLVLFFSAFFNILRKQVLLVVGKTVYEFAVKNMYYQMVAILAIL